LVGRVWWQKEVSVNSGDVHNGDRQPLEIDWSHLQGTRVDMDVLPV